MEDEVRGLVVTLIERAVTNSFPDAQVFPFGSYETKLYLPLGDIDLVVLSQSMAYSDRQTSLYALANALKRSGITPKVTVIARAKVPIVKFVTTHGRFNVDISVNQQNGIISGSIINGFLNDMHTGGKVGSGNLALRSLVLIAKAFLSQRSMNEVYTGGLGSYSVVCMAISFLQMHPKIRRGEINPDKNLGVLVMDFFELYGCYFNYEEAGISLRNGGYYFKKKQRGWVDFQKGGLISIEDPADTTNDISRGSFGFQRVRMALAGAHGILTSIAYLRAGILNSRHHSRSFRLRDRYEAQDVSLLSSIMGVTQETVNHRKLVQEVYDRKVLHNLVGIAPKPIVNGNLPTRRSGPNVAQDAVHSAWKANEEDVDHSPRPAAVPDEEEEGRYHIGRHPPHKRRKLGRRADTHTVFIADDDGDDSSYGAHSEIEDHHGGHHGSRRGRPERTEKAERLRLYWLAKGAGMPDEEGEDKG
ncbi:hypothetical protein AX15_002738 [Amanita polypyramis BW_CC]|nr:hypothetical protein AX15_002738 [Amanita polypyramis BW_CC]